MSHKHTATGTWRIKPSDNKSIAIGNVLLSEAFFRKYGLDREISKLKAKGIDLAKLGDNFSIFRAHEFIMEPVIRERFGLDEFNVKSLYRAVERLGQNRERIVAAFRQRVLGRVEPADQNNQSRIGDDIMFGAIGKVDRKMNVGFRGATNKSYLNTINQCI